jgi:hypothetical protein
MRSERRFKRGRSRRRSLRHMFTSKGWLLLTALMVLSVIAAVLVGRGEHHLRG